MVEPVLEPVKVPPVKDLLVSHFLKELFSNLLNEAAKRNG